MIIYEIKNINFVIRMLKNFIFFLLLYLVPLIIYDNFSRTGFDNFNIMVLIIITIAIIKSLINEYKFLNKIEFSDSGILIDYYIFFKNYRIKIKYNETNVYIFYGYPRTRNTNYLVVKVNSKKIIKQYRSWGWKTETFEEIVKTYETFKLDANKDV